MKTLHIFLLNALVKNLILLTIGIALLTHSCTLKNYEEHDVSFSNPDDNVRLSATLSAPKSDTLLPAVVLVHGSGAHERDLVMGNHKIFKTMAEYLASHGIAVLRFDKRGCGKSGGIYAPFDLESFSSDALAGIEFLRKQKAIDPSKIGAIGLSQGGIITPIMAVKSENVKFIIMMAGLGVEAKDALHASQLAITKAAGASESRLEEVSRYSLHLWKILVKKDITDQERIQGIGLLKDIWSSIDEESRQDFGFLDQNASYFFNELYRAEAMLEFYNYNPRETLLKVKCPTLVLNGDKDVQVVADTNLPAIEDALENGICPDYATLKLKNHNHIFQKCKTGKISEYKYIDHAISQESMNIIVDWIFKVN